MPDSPRSGRNGDGIMKCTSDNKWVTKCINTSKRAMFDLGFKFNV